MAAPPQALTTIDDVDALIMGLAPHPIVVITITGSPIVQARPRVSLANGHPRVYDPSQREKRAYRRAIGKAMAQLGYSEFPFFERKLLKLKATFGLSNNSKDADNLLKFLMDALESVLYDNDACVMDAQAIKKRVPIGDQYTTFELEEELL
jgi:Holliday junction resolvase RusA-like endonuclease